MEKKYYFLSIEKSILWTDGFIHKRVYNICINKHPIDWYNENSIVTTPATSERHSILFWSEITQEQFNKFGVKDEKTKDNE